MNVNMYVKRFCYRDVSPVGVWDCGFAFSCLLGMNHVRTLKSETQYLHFVPKRLERRSLQHSKRSVGNKYNFLWEVLLVSCTL